jgi:LacI family transcriptional regulator
VQVNDVARHCGVSRSLLEKRFKKVLGHTVYEEISRVQMSKACELLTHTELPIKRIASLCGFSTVQYMTSKFKNLHQLSPGDYRKSRKG